jgi:hypothetical protein
MDQRPERPVRLTFTLDATAAVAALRRAGCEVEAIAVEQRAAEVNRELERLGMAAAAAAIEATRPRKDPRRLF